MSNETIEIAQPSVDPQSFVMPALDRLNAQDLLHWVRLLWPAALVVAGGGLFFAEAIVDTIESTPHPALVYTIFGGCLVALLAAMAALHLYIREARIARNWLKHADMMRSTAVYPNVGNSVFAPVYNLLAGGAALDDSMRQNALNTEIDVAQHQLDDRLELPNFLGGALVGLGLVGTFVGLLGTLEDLSKVFSALLNSGSTTMSPTEMFADMVSKLQAPMRGMGTAFVASLYGLLGSLIVTMMLVGARKTGAATLKQVLLVVRKMDYGSLIEGAPAVKPLAERAEAQQAALAVQEMQRTLDNLRVQFEKGQQQQLQLEQQSTQAIQVMAKMVEDMAAAQVQLQQKLQTQLRDFQEVMANDRKNLVDALQIARQDAFATFKAIEVCRTSFEQSSRRLGAVLSYLDAGQGSSQ